MNITKEHSSDLLATLTIKIEKADYEHSVSKILKDYQKKAAIPGFRPGKVPAGLVKKLYYRPALADEVNKLIPNELSQYIVKENLNLLGDPLPNEEKQTVIDWNKDEDFEFIFDIALAPEIKVALDKTQKLTYYNITPDEETIAKQVQAYTGRLGENIEVEEAGEKDLLRGDFVQLDAEGNEKENGIKAEQVLISIDLIKDEAIKKEIIGKKSNDTIIFDPLKAYENKHEVGHMLNISHEEADGIEGDFRFTISKILRFQPATINEDFFKKAFGEETEIKTEEQFREKLKNDLEKSLKPSSDYKFLTDTRNSFIDSIKMELPEEFLKRWIKITNKEITEEQVETEFPGFLQNLRWDLIKSSIIKDNDIKVEEEDMKASARKYIEIQFMQYGMFNMQDDYLDKYADDMLGNEDERKHIQTRAFEEKIIDLVKSKVSIKEKNINDQEFAKLMQPDGE